MQWKSNGPHELDLQHQFMVLAQKPTNYSTKLAQLLFDNALKSSALFLKLLEPEELDLERKIEYATEILNNLQHKQNETLPTMEVNLDETEGALRELANFVHSHASVVERGLAPGEGGMAQGAIVTPPNDDVTLEGGDDAAALGIQIRDEFLDNVEYRRIARSLMLTMREPIEVLTSGLQNYGDIQERFQTSVNRWRSTGPHPVEKEQWVTEHLNKSVSLSKTLSSMMLKLSTEGRSANRAFLTSLASNQTSTTEALRLLNSSRRQELDDFLPQVKTLFDQIIANYEEVVEFTDSSLNRDVPKSRRRFLRDRE